MRPFTKLTEVPITISEFFIFSEIKKRRKNEHISFTGSENWKKINGSTYICTFVNNSEVTYWTF